MLKRDFYQDILWYEMNILNLNDLPKSHDKVLMELDLYVLASDPKPCLLLWYGRQ